jgi:hypothetical protein
MPGTMWVLAQSNDTVKKPVESFFGNGSDLNDALLRKYSGNSAQDSSQIELVFSTKQTKLLDSNNEILVIKRQ